MLTEQEQEKIRGEERYRHTVREELANDTPGKTSGEKVRDFFNSGFGLWLLSAVFISGSGALYATCSTHNAENRQNAEMVEKLNREIGYRYSQVLAKLKHTAEVGDENNGGDVDWELKLLYAQPSAPERNEVTNLYSDFEKMGVPTLIALETSHMKKIGSETSQIEKVLAQLVALQGKEMKIEAPAAAQIIQRDLLIEQWRNTGFPFMKCTVDKPFCEDVSQAQARPREKELTKRRAIVPAYFYPVADGLEAWNNLIEAAKSIPIIAIANPNSGPGKDSDPAYVDVIARSRRAGIDVIGYVSTDHGKRAPALIHADVDHWVALYPQINGIFFDEQASGDDKSAFYAEVFAYARSKIGAAIVVGNPGTIPSEQYFDNAKANIECIFEDRVGFDKLTLPKWAANYPHDHFCALVFDVGDAGTMESFVRHAAELGIGNVYLTNDRLPNPWDTLPGYWNNEISALLKPTQP